MALNKRQIQREGTLGLIYETVNQLVREKGFEQMRIKDICQRAGISTGAFYHHFGSKQDILYERYRASNLLVEELYREGLQMAPVEALKHLVAEMTEYTRSRVPGVLKSYMEATVRHGAQWRSRKVGMTLTEAARYFVQAGMDRGHIRPGVDPDQAAMAVGLYLSGISLEQAVTEGRFLLENRPEEGMCRYLEGLRADFAP